MSYIDINKLNKSNEIDNEIHKEIIYGVPFSKPPIRKTTIPGGWTILDSDSPILKNAIEYVLSYIKNTLHIILADKIKIKIFTCASQVVMGLNIYIEFRLYSENITLDIQTVVCEHIIFDNDSKNLNESDIKNIYITTKLFLEDK